MLYDTPQRQGRPRSPCHPQNEDDRQHTTAAVRIAITQGPRKTAVVTADSVMHDRDKADGVHSAHPTPPRWP